MSKNGYSDIKKYARRIDKLNFDYEFSVCTLITNPLEYQKMVRSFHDKGFTHPQCEFLYIDNTRSCTFDAYKGLNRFLQSAKGKYIILCHQDILLHDSNKNDLLDCISEIEKQDPNWAVLGNAGGINFKWLAMHVTQGCGNFLKENLLPLQTKTVDENFIVVKNEANLALSNDLNGFHMYGADLCLISDILGFTSYVIAFNIIHKSNGNVNAEFYRIKKKFIKKYARALRSRFMATTITRYFLSGNLIKLRLYNLPPIKFLVRQYYKLFKPKKTYYLFAKK